MKIRTWLKLAGMLAAVLCLGVVRPVAADDIPLDGVFPTGYIQTMLHLGANFDTDDLDGTKGGIGHDYLAAAGGETMIRPSNGQVLVDLDTSGTSQEPAGTLTWTPMHRDTQRWQPAGDRNQYVKYWCIYIISPDEREVDWRHLSDDGIRLWVNGNLQVSYDGVTDTTTRGRLYAGVNCVLVKLEEGGGGDYLDLCLRKPGSRDQFDDLTYRLYDASFQLGDAETGSGGLVTSGAVKVRSMPALDGYIRYQICQNNAEGTVKPDPMKWKDIDFDGVPSETIPYMNPANLGDKIYMTLFLANEDGSVIDASTVVLATQNAYVSSETKPDEFGATLTVTALTKGQTEGVMTFGLAPDALTKTAVGDKFAGTDGTAKATYDFGVLDTGVTYYWGLTLYENGQKSGQANGSFTTLKVAQHGQVGEINAEVSTVGDDVVLTYKKNGVVVLTRDATLDLLLVGGGGGGGTLIGGGGGGGGVLALERVKIPAGKYKVVVGEGGVGANWDGTILAANGGDSSVFDIVAYGGGAGGGSGYIGDGFYDGSYAGKSGGSGGGAAGHRDLGGGEHTPGGGVFGQGFEGGAAAVHLANDVDNNWGAGGGGGGAGAPGGLYLQREDGVRVGGTGGDGLVCAITGTEVVYGGGGGGGTSTYYHDAASLGGAGGGGRGGWLNSGTNGGMSGTDGVDGLGGGGGGGGLSWNYNSDHSTHGGRGGSGVVIIRCRQTFDPDSYAGEGGEVKKIKGWAIHTFRQSGTFTIPCSVSAQVLLVGGGGGGGRGYAGGAGGGGAGGMLVLPVANITAGTHEVTIGAGGTGGGANGTDYATNGGDTRFAGWTAVGGGAGGGIWGGNGAPGGSGGGTYAYVQWRSAYTGGAATPGQGYAGGSTLDRVEGVETLDGDYYGAGGGGAGGPGEQPGDRPGQGGIGRPCDYSGEEVWYAGGGSGGAYTDRYQSPCEGPQGGGGAGGYFHWDGDWRLEAAADGVDGLGGGGGGGALGWGNTFGAGGNGGSGIVIIRYKLRPTGTMLYLR